MMFLNMIKLGKNSKCPMDDDVPVHYGILHCVSVADRGCLSRIRIFFHPGSRLQQKKRRGKNKLFVLNFFGAINFTILKILQFLIRHRKRFESFDKESEYF
jgi:hypothetical protein